MSIQETTLNIYMDASNIYTHIISIEEDTVSRLAHKRSDGFTSLLYLWRELYYGLQSKLLLLLMKWRTAALKQIKIAMLPCFCPSRFLIKLGKIRKGTQRILITFKSSSVEVELPEQSSLYPKQNWLVWPHYSLWALNINADIKQSLRLCRNTVGLT
jgi:hypothetical protein